jgi:hypothetical protein
MDEQARLSRRLRRRGTLLLLAHCALFERLVAGDRARPRDRLESRLGPELSRQLVRSLAGDHALRPRDLAA